MASPFSSMQTSGPVTTDSGPVSNMGGEMAVFDSEESTKEREELVNALWPEVMCEICYSLFYDPVTTPCQHVRLCLFFSISGSDFC
jgi:hypothetical protein